MAKGKKKTELPKSTAQQLGSIVKSCRDLMRKDKGLNGDLDRLPMLTWIMFLKFLDDMEEMRREEAQLAGKKFRQAIDPPYRWRDWAAKPDGMTGPELIAFINQEEAVRPDGEKGAGLFAYLRGLQSTNGDRRDVIAKVFEGTVNRMINGYLLRDVVNKVNEIHFTSQDEIHTLGHLYESLLREMRDAAGDSGEFYTPRPVVKFIVTVVGPRLGETVLDPAAGTGGFLVESFEYLKKQAKKAEDFTCLQKGTLRGIEPKPLPYLLCQMNLLLHGVEYPEIDPGNALRSPLREIGDRDRVDVIVTNPPFGGEEEKGILSNFPEDKQTTETALLFLQLVMRRIRRNPPGRVGIVVPNGVLYASGVASRIRRDLIEKFNLHTVVRLPKGVFEPYADIPTNILFFDGSKPADKVWFYEHPLPPHRAILRSPSYSQSEPLKFEEFQPLIGWWNDRVENEHAWCVPTTEIAGTDYSLDRKNPHRPEVGPVDLATLGSGLKKQADALQRKLEGLEGSLQVLNNAVTNGSGGKQSTDLLGSICDFTKGNSPTKKMKPGPYTFVVTAKQRKTAESYQFEKPAVCIPVVSSTGHGHASIHRIHFEEGKFALANIMVAVTVKPEKEKEVDLKYLYYYLWSFKDEKLVKLMRGTANTALTVKKLRTVSITYPGLKQQEAVANALDAVLQDVRNLLSALKACETDSELILDAALYGTFDENGKAEATPAN